MVLNITDKVRKYIVSNNIRDALDCLNIELQRDKLVDLKLLDQLVMISRSYSHLQVEKHNGTLSFEAIERQESIITRNIIGLSTEISKRETEKISLPKSGDYEMTLLSKIKSSKLLSSAANSLLKSDTTIDNIIIQIIEKEKQKTYGENIKEIERLNIEIKMLKKRLALEKAKSKEFRYLYKQSKENLNIQKKNNRFYRKFKYIII